jgi:hypothetical protein
MPGRNGERKKVSEGGVRMQAKAEYGEVEFPTSSILL